MFVALVKLLLYSPTLWAIFEQIYGFTQFSDSIPSVITEDSRHPLWGPAWAYSQDKADSCIKKII